MISLAVHPTKQIAATGQVAVKGRDKEVDVFVWDIDTQEVLAKLDGFHQGGISTLAFSPNGSQLLTIGMDR